MEEINDTIHNDLFVKHELRIRGIIDGNVTVQENSYLILNEIINGDLIINNFAKCDLHGIVKGNVTNRGGELVIHSIVNGNLNKESGNTVVDSNAVITSNS